MRVLSLFTLLFGLYTLGSAQIFNPVDWSFKSEQIEGDQYKLIFHADIDQGWNIYSQFIDEGGPVPTSFTFDQSDHFGLVDGVTESKNAKTQNDAIFEMEVTKFSKYADFEQIVTISDISKPISGYLTFMTCDDVRCLPPKDVEFSIQATPSQSEDRADSGEPIPSESLQTPVVPVEGSTDKVLQSQNEKPVVKETMVTQSDAKDEASASNISIAVTEQEEGQGESQEISFGVNDNASSAPVGLEEPVKWTYAFEKISDSEYDLIFKAKVDDGWQIYSQFVAEGGPWPTQIFLDENDAYKARGDATESGSKREESYDRIFEMNLIKYKKDATFTQRVQVNDPNQIIHGEVEYMTCNDEKCIGPLGAEFSFDLINRIATSGDLLVNTQKLAEGRSNDGSKEIINNEVESLQASYLDPIGDCGEEDNAAGKGLLTTFLLGFAGGLLALLTPCVFPMIPLTVSFFTKDTKRKGWVNGALYGLSIVVIYVSLGILLTVVFGPDVLNRLSTSWIANTLFFIIFMFFAFSFFGFYEITLPSKLANSSDSMADKGGMLGIFFMAFTLAIVSFSCTGPIIGSALVAATSKGVLGPGIVMFGFALALAIPFGLFAAFPAWLNSLPKSGGWMNSVKVMLGFLEVALAFKFLSVADMTSHWGVLKYELFMGIWVLVAIGMALYMFGILKFPHDSPVKKLNATRWVLGLGMAAISVYLISGFMLNDKTKTYYSLKAMSGSAPPANYNFFIKPQDPDASIKDRYPSFSKCANNLDCFKDYYEGVSYAKEVGKPILLDFTGYGCVNCRKTEEHIWIKDDVWQKISEEYILVSLYVDDRKPLDEELYLPSSTRPISYIGKIWGNFQEVNFQQNSQPLYVLVTPDEEVLAKPRGYKPDAKSYDDFLECGLETFELHKSQLLGSRQ